MPHRHCERSEAIQALPNGMRDLIRMLNKFSIKICSTGLPRRDFVPPRNDGFGCYTNPHNNARSQWRYNL
ncbi:hypothetical protein [Rickettsia endosymbiont of Orchestes rusci]|uniref:hypothetical protein n=1 Tax=Rickettsia endosymbiont of Orchestes rusci TaxID=3066250 RepID=UPI00313B83B3